MALESVNSACPCGSGLKYKKCCRRFHDGLAAPDALHLMKSRYSAYAVGAAQYIMDTTDPRCPEYDAQPTRWLESIRRFSRDTAFESLTILAFVDGSPQASVTFRAQLKRDGVDVSFTEESEFVLVSGRWFYLRGEPR